MLQHNKLTQTIKEIKRQRKEKNRKSHDFYTKYYLICYLNEQA